MFFSHSEKISAFFTLVLSNCSSMNKFLSKELKKFSESETARKIAEKFYIILKQFFDSLRGIK